eukprot:2272451-Pleurochrysis_carterae.AAC.1
MRVSIRNVAPASHGGIRGRACLDVNACGARRCAACVHCCSRRAPVPLQARALIEKSTFDFMGEPMSLVDARWCEDRFARSDAVLHALVNGAQRAH